jgi:hypothetical protein
VSDVPLDPLGAAKETGGVVKSVFGWVRAKIRRPKLDVWPEIGTDAFRDVDESGRPRSRPGSFLWINVKNRAQSPHSTARGVIGHVFLSDQRGEIYGMRARWRGSPYPLVGRDGEIDRFNIGPGFSEQLDVAWKLPADEQAWGFNSEVLLKHPDTWRDDRYRLSPGRYTVKVKVEPSNGRPVERSFPLVVAAGQPLRLADAADGLAAIAQPSAPVAGDATSQIPAGPDGAAAASVQREASVTASSSGGADPARDSRGASAQGGAREKTEAPPIPWSLREPHFDRTSGEEPTVAVHYVGDGSQYVNGLPADPTRTTYVTGARAAELVGAGLYESGEAPEVPDEAGRAMANARAALVALVARARELEGRIRALGDDGRDPSHESYWVLQVRNFEANVEAFTSAHLVTGRRDGLSGVPPAVTGSSGWSEALAEYMAARGNTLEEFVPAIQRVDIGFGPRAADPTTVFSTTDPKWGVQVTLRADPHGRLWPRTRREAEALDRAGFRDIADEWVPASGVGLKQGDEAPQKRDERLGIQRDARAISSTYRGMETINGIRSTAPEVRAEWRGRVSELRRRLAEYVDRWSVVLPDSATFSSLVPPVDPDWLEAMAHDADVIAWQLDHEDGGRVREHNLAAVGGTTATCTCGRQFDTGPAFEEHQRTGM